MIFDTHAHYDDESFDDDRERLLAGFPAQGVHAVTNIGTNIRASEETVRMTEKYENLYGVVGIFPSEVAELENPDNVKRLKELAKHDKIVRSVKSDSIIIMKKRTRHCSTNGSPDRWILHAS